jgi:hypothetical protein
MGYSSVEPVLVAPSGHSGRSDSDHHRRLLRELRALRDHMALAHRRGALRRGTVRAQRSRARPSLGVSQPRHCPLGPCWARPSASRGWSSWRGRLAAWGAPAWRSRCSPGSACSAWSAARTGSCTRTPWSSRRIAIWAIGSWIECTRWGRYRRAGRRSQAVRRTSRHAPDSQSTSTGVSPATERSGSSRWLTGLFRNSKGQRNGTTEEGGQGRGIAPRGALDGAVGIEEPRARRPRRGASS